MCLILFAWQAHPRYPLVLAANRDEFHRRPTAAAGFWSEAPDLLAGRDLQAGGTWLGVTRSGRFAALTNYREPPVPEPALECSRGALVRDYLLSDESPQVHAERLRQTGANYRGFNLLCGDGADLICASNRGPASARVAAGSHALSNHLLDTDWPKARHGLAGFDKLLTGRRIAAEDLLELLSDSSAAPGEEPPSFGMHLAPEGVTRTIFIRSPDYGTRSSTVLLVDREGRVEFVERQFDAQGRASGEGRFQFALS